MAEYLPRRALFVLLACMALFIPPSVTGREDGRIGVLYVGCTARSRPFWEMRSDPLFSISFVQATMRDWGAIGPIQAGQGAEIYRFVRLYMPRTYKDLASRFDVIVISNANRFAVEPYIRMLARGVRDSGMGLVMFGGWETFGGAFGRPAWGETEIGELLPTRDVIDTWVQYPQNGILLRIDDREHEFISSLPWKRERAYFMNDFHHNLVKLKPGARKLAHAESVKFKDHPAMVTWEVENQARVFAYTGEIYFFCRKKPFWTYYIDFGSNLMIYLDHRDVPQDIDLVHTLRSQMQDVATRKSLLLGLLEFCDSFGANTDKIERKIDQINTVIAQATPYYLDLEIERTLDAYREADNMIKNVEQDAVELKNRALMWVYVIEWLAVTGTAMGCGFIVWSVMVRRRLYKEVSTTRLEEEISRD